MDTQPDPTPMVVDALARYEVQSRWPSLKPDRVEENVALMRSDGEIQRAAATAVRAMRDFAGAGGPDPSSRHDAWRRAGVEAAADYVRRHADRYAAYALSASSLERHLERMLADLGPSAPVKVGSPVEAVKLALARASVASRWPSLRPDLVETNVAMMTSDRQIVRQAEISVAIVRAAAHEADPDLARQDNRDLLAFQQGAETDARYFVTLSARQWLPRSIGWGLKNVADDIKRSVRPN